MKPLTLALVATLALPLTAQAWCGGMPAGSSVQSCEQGVKVIRHQPLALPRIDPATARAIALKREQIALQRQTAQGAAALERRRLDQRDREITQRDYLYRDANSPLRPFGHGVFGFGHGAYGPIYGEVFQPGIAPGPRPLRRGRRH